MIAYNCFLLPSWMASSGGGIDVGVTFTEDLDDSYAEEAVEALVG